MGAESSRDKIITAIVDKEERGVLSIDHMPIAENTVNANTVFELGEGYRKLIAKKEAEMLEKNPDAPE